MSERVDSGAVAKVLVWVGREGVHRVGSRKGLVGVAVG